MQNIDDTTNHLRCGLLDFQVGECHEDIPFDASEYVRKSAAAGFQELLFICKDAYGNAYYDSSLVKRNAAIRNDYIQQAVEAGRKYGVGIFAYFNVLLDDKVAEQYPAYRMVNSKGEQILAYNYYKSLCPNSPYLQIVKERLAELLHTHDIQGLFFDITYFQPDTCFCRYCCEKFEMEYGYPLSTDIQRNKKELKDWYEFRRKSRYNLLEELVKAVQSVKNIPITWNRSCGYRIGHIEIDRYASFLSTEFHAPQYLDGIIGTKWGHSRGKHCKITVPFELSGWGDWTLCPKNSMKAVFSTIIANGCGIYINHVPYPSGEFASTINENTLGEIKANFDEIKLIEPWLQNCASVPDIAVLYSLQTLRLFEWFNPSSSSTNANSTYDFYASIYGIVKMLLYGNRHFDILAEDSIQKRANEYNVIILPDAACLEDETLPVLREFVKNGGKLIATNFTSLYDNAGHRKDNFALSDLFGVDYEASSNYSVDYMYDFIQGIGGGVPDMPILVKDAEAKSLRVSMNQSAIKIATQIEPLFEASIDRHVYHQHAHPARRSAFPSIVINHVGKGQCLYFASQIFTSFFKTGSPWLKKIFLNSLDLIYKDPLIQVDAPTSVQVYLMQQHDKYILHLVNINDVKIDISMSSMESMIPIHNTVVNIRIDAKRVYTVPDMQELDFTSSDGRVQFTIDKIDVHKIIVIE
jgi:hypothetical protein